jgi:hypothetical protein
MPRPNKKHHVVPRVYLQPFADDNGRFWVLSFTGDSFTIRQDKPANVLTKNDYYTIRLNNGGGSLVIETKLLGGIETAYAKLYKEKIEPQLPLTEHERGILAIFAASMLLRSPARRKAIEQLFSDVREMTDKMRAIAESSDAARRAMASMPRSSSEPGIPADEFLKAGEDVATLHSSMIPEGVASIAQRLYNMGYSFMVRESDEVPFVTSDTPCTLTNPSLPLNSFYGPDLEQKDVELSLPLSPDVALLYGWQIEHSGFYIPVPMSSVEQINWRTARGADTLISSKKSLLEKRLEFGNANLAKKREGL